MLTIDLSGKNVLVTGGSRGIGAACCRLFAQAGANVGVHYLRDEAAAAAVVDEVRAAGGKGVALQAEISDPGAVALLFRRFLQEIGPLDVLVNNAGIWKRAPIDRMSPEELEEMLGVNLEGTIHCCREAARAFGGAGGAIVNISSTAGQRGEAHYSHYAASKGGVHALTKSLGEELGPAVRVNCVAPGWVETDMGRAIREEPGRMERILAEIPTRRIASAEDIAAAVLFLSSDMARQITAEVLNVNGGSVRCG